MVIHIMVYIYNDSYNGITYWCGAKRRVAGWVAGGCWDDDMTRM